MTVWVGRGDASTSQVLSGSVIIQDAHVFFTRPCHGSGLQADIDRGTSVAIRDGNGRPLTTTVLQRGVPVGYHACVFAFVVRHLHPTDTLAVQIGNRNSIMFGANDRHDNNWSVELQAQGTRIVNYS
jgi:hypothetical protein